MQNSTLLPSNSSVFTRHYLLPNLPANLLRTSLLQPGRRTDMKENRYWKVYPHSVKQSALVCLKLVLEEEIGSRIGNQAELLIRLFLHFKWFSKNLLSLGTSCRNTGRRKNMKLCNTVLLSPENTIIHLLRRRS